MEKGRDGLRSLVRCPPPPAQWSLLLTAAVMQGGWASWSGQDMLLTADLRFPQQAGFMSLIPQVANQDQALVSFGPPLILQLLSHSL